MDPAEREAWTNCAYRPDLYAPPTTATAAKTRDDTSSAAAGSRPMPVQRRVDGNVESAAPAPIIAGKLLGEWGETLTSAKLIGGALIGNPHASDGGFDSHDEAQVWATAMMAQQSADGGVILERKGRYCAYTMVSQAWFEDFDRDNLESGFDTLHTAGGQVPGIRSFLTRDGYAASPTVTRAENRSQTVYIVEREREARYRKAAGPARSAARGRC